MCNENNENIDYIIHFGYSWYQTGTDYSTLVKQLDAVNGFRFDTHWTNSTFYEGNTLSDENHDFLMQGLVDTMRGSSCLFIHGLYYNNSWSQLEIEAANHLNIPYFVIIPYGAMSILNAPLAGAPGSERFLHWNAKKIASTVGKMCQTTDEN